MAKFTVRITLHEAEWEEYSKLYDSLEKEGFRDTISSDKASYKLPDGEYAISGNYSLDDILNKAKKAINSTSVEGSVLVTQSSGRTWFGLDKV
jgi:hypothetical protein